MILKYSDVAKHSGARIVSCCGFDSIPSDLGVHFLQRQGKQRFGKYFDDVKLIGLTKDEVIETVGNPKTSNDSKYNFPFFKVNDETMVYRFDTGAYGWQINIHFDKNGRASRVEKKWIH